MESSFEIKKAFERVNYYIEQNNCQIVAPIIDSIMLEYAEQYFKLSESDNEDEIYCIV